MTGLRDARAAVLTRWHRDLGDNFTAVLPRVLDDLEAADRAQEAPRKLSAAEVTAWALAHRGELSEITAHLNALDEGTARASADAASGVPHPDAPSLAGQVASARTAAPRAPVRARKPRGGTAT